MTTEAEFFERFPDSPPCSCRICREMCRRPCWPTPSEARRLIEAGYGAQLMLDFWAGEAGSEDTYILCPATPGSESTNAPWWPTSGCIMQKEGLCALHTLGLKPAEGRIAHHANQTNAHEPIALLWDSDDGRALVAEWQEKFMK